MDLPGFIKNKYTVSALILLGLLGTDVILHRGMSRVILPEPFTDKVQPYLASPAASRLENDPKNWTRGVDKTAWLDRVPAERGGIEFDAYMDTASGRFLVYHDSERIARLQADTLLTAIRQKGIKGGIWMDLKNLNRENLNVSLREARRLRDQYGLQNRTIIESSSAELLHVFTEEGFYTSYYIPYFNPYLMSEDSLVYQLQTIRKNLERFPCSALSGYYFQYPVLRKFFPRYPVLTWADETNVSLVGYYFRRTLEKDSMVRVVLYPLPS